MKSGNHYLVKVKANQPNLKTAVENTIHSTDPIGYYREEEISRGRLEIRETYLHARVDNMDKGWDSVQLIVYVRRDFLSNKKEHKTESLYVSDLCTRDARYIARGTRSHWFIENKLHYTKDVIMMEDKRCTRNKLAAMNLALLRDFAFNILKTKNASIKRATEIFANYDVKELMNILYRT